MSSRIIAQLIINGASIFTRAFINAYQQALRNAKAGGGASNATARAMRLKMQPDEAMKIMHIEKHEMNVAKVEERYKKLFDANDPGKGGSFYLQSKVFRSREVLLKELQDPSKEETDRDAAPQNSSGSINNSSAQNKDDVPK